MESTGMVRKIDSMGRVVLPAELRKVMHISKYDNIEVYIEENSIIFEKNVPTCVFCGRENELVQYKDKSICRDCIKRMIAIKELQA